MPYNNTGGRGAADALGGGGEEAEAPEAQGQGEEQAESSFMLPSENIPGGENLKAGDTITLKVVGMDDKGQIQVQMMNEGQQAGGQAPGASVMDGFDDSMK